MKGRRVSGTVTGDEEMRPGQLFLQMVGEPLLGCMLLALGTVAVATGVMDAVFFPTVWALIEAMPIMAAAAVLDGADDLAVRGGEVGIALQVFWRKGGEDIAAGWSWQEPVHEGIEALVGLFMPCVGEVEGDHGGFEWGMSQGALDEAGIHTSFEQMGGVGMAAGYGWRRRFW